MPGILFCPNCGASIEGEKNKCNCCGAALGETQNQQSSGAVPPPQSNQFGQQNFGQIPPQQPNQFNQQNFGQIPPQPLQYESYNQYSQNDGAYNGCAIAGMVLGIISIVLCCLYWLDVIVGIAGIVLSIIGLKSYKHKGCATAGLICSIAGTLLALVTTFGIMLDL